MEGSGHEGREEEEGWVRWGGAFALWRGGCGRSFDVGGVCCAAAAAVGGVEGELRLADCVGVADAPVAAAAAAPADDVCVNVSDYLPAGAVHARRRSSSSRAIISSSLVPSAVQLNCPNQQSQQAGDCFDYQKFYVGL